MPADWRTGGPLRGGALEIRCKPDSSPSQPEVRRSPLIARSTPAPFGASWHRCLAAASQTGPVLELQGPLARIGDWERWPESVLIICLAVNKEQSVIVVGDHRASYTAASSALFSFAVLTPPFSTRPRFVEHTASRLPPLRGGLVTTASFATFLLFGILWMFDPPTLQPSLPSRQPHFVTSLQANVAYETRLRLKFSQHSK